MKKMMACILAFTMAFLTGCAGEALPDTYLEDSDYQYTQWTSGVFYPKLQQGSGVVYLFHDGFVYYLEEGTEAIMPLCSRADCLHDREPEEEKRKDCNAYMGTYEGSHRLAWVNAAMAKCGDFLYCMNEILSLNDPQTLLRCSLDGTIKETVYTWDSGESAIVEWIIHRDTLYYVETRYYLDEEGETLREVSLKALPLLRRRAKPVTLYTADENLTVISMGNFKAYGNFVYFDIVAIWKGGGENETLEELYARHFDKTLVYSIRDGSVETLDIPGLPVSASIADVQFWQDRLILAPYDGMKAGDALMPVYIAGLDGSDPQILFEGVPQESCFLSDGEYLYLFHNWMPDIDDWLSNPGFYTVYDKNLNIVDTFTAPLLPNGRAGQMPAGGKDRMYFLYEDYGTGEWGVMRWDKSGIGSYGGEEIQVEYIRR